MLSKPKNGWTDFELGKNSYKLSYLTDVSIDWLDSAIDGLKNTKPFVVRGFLEPLRVMCVVSFWNVHLFVESDEDDVLDTNESNYEIIHMNMIEFCKHLYNDINDNLQEWINWFCDDEYDLEKREKELIKRLEKLRDLIDKQKEYFSDSYFFL